MTIFTAVAWLSNATRSFAIISDNLSHNKCSVYAFLKKIILELKKQNGKLKYISIFSDGCAAQFKNRYTLSNLCFMEQDYGVTAEWNFFATSHGKGAVDAVGGLVKRTVWLEVKSRKASISNALEFHNCAESKLTKIKILFVCDNEIELNKDMLSRRWSCVKSIPRIQSKHHFEKLSCQQLLTGLTSSSSLEICEVVNYS